MSGELLLAVPIAVAALIWWESFRRTGKWGKSLPVFLLGYGFVVMFSGFRYLAGGWEQVLDDVSECILNVALLTGAAYVTGFIAWVLLAMIVAATGVDSMELGRFFAIEALAGQQSPQ